MRFAGQVTVFVPREEGLVQRAVERDEPLAFGEKQREDAAIGVGARADERVRGEPRVSDGRAPVRQEGFARVRVASRARGEPREETPHFGAQHRVGGDEELVDGRDAIAAELIGQKVEPVVGVLVVHAVQQTRGLARARATDEEDGLRGVRAELTHAVFRLGHAEPVLAVAGGAVQQRANQAVVHVVKLLQDVGVRAWPNGRDDPNHLEILRRRADDALLVVQRLNARKLDERVAAGRLPRAVTKLHGTRARVMIPLRLFVRLADDAKRAVDGVVIRQDATHA